jgi:hypothetical protein
MRKVTLLDARAVVQPGARVEHLDAEVDEVPEGRRVFDVSLVEAGQEDVAPAVLVGAAAQEVVAVVAVHRADGNAHRRGGRLAGRSGPAPGWG